jgi:hypothetical protein
MTIKPLAHSGDSSNIAYYSEPETGNGNVWASVLRNDFTHTDGRMQLRPLPAFHLSIYRIGTGEVARVTYNPKTKPAPGPLPARTVTRIVRSALAGDS